MLVKIGLGLLWLGFVVYAFLFAPPDSPDTLDLIKRLSVGDIGGINPLIVALFNLMGVWPLAYSCLLFADGRGQKIRAFPFVIGSFALGAFALLPYLALREPNPTFVGKKDKAISAFDSRLLGVLLTIAAVGLVAFGLSQGNWTDFVQQWKTSRFIHVMSLDFCLLCVLFPTLLGDDLARRNFKKAWVFWLVCLVPLFGPLLYLCLRPSLEETTSQEEAKRSPVATS
ncbi:DUF2834 domain-containing protein [Oscillatoria sp. FACHB-1406]|uniref:DUF2834 domain-containing protein n=1 Tax=Oscillatoria sp. FACHB-1406 TaxID=2692846 RepID=UPI0016840072|nr:DUF2834 domain-containing protein [Oscillatoria sp. FACHB-1406]MBD2577270.1 DUF2834 domain-containing protein [Oscillatoria sp. FACHB-1406]